MSALTALLIFLASFLLDGLYAKYLDCIARRHALSSAGLNGVWHLVSAAMVAEYTQTPLYIIPLTLGGMLGTYVSIRLTRAVATAE